jgi:cytochrome c2
MCRVPIPSAGESEHAGRCPEYELGGAVGPSMLRNLTFGLALFCVASLCAPPAGYCAADDAPPQVGTDQSALPQDPLTGRALFVGKGCISCHAVWGQGGNLGPDLTRAKIGLTLLEFAGVLWNHSPAMIEMMRSRRIPRQTISTTEMADLASFLYSLDYFDSPGDPRAGEALFSAKRCIRCHSVGGKGGKVGPALDGFKQFASPLFLVRGMWSHGPQMTAKMATLDVTPPRFHGHELADIFAYIQEVALGNSSGKVYMVPGSPAQGEKIFVEKGCIRCHSVRGTGGHIGPDLSKIGFHKGITQIAGEMWNHAPGMWGKMHSMGIAVPQFSGQDISDILAYLYFLQYYDQPGDPTAGQRIFFDKGCVLCHYAPEGGKPVGPDLSRSTAVSSPIAMCSAMWNHAPAMEALFRQREIPWPHFEASEVRDLVAYLRSRQTVARTLH